MDLNFDETCLAQDGGDGCRVHPVDIDVENKLSFKIDGNWQRTYFLLTVCAQWLEAGEVAIEYQYVNHGNNHLSCEYLRYPETFLYVALVWLATTLLWCRENRSILIAA